MAGVLNAVDLFTGVGGFALAMEGMYNPLLYCDNLPQVISTLRTLMTKGSLPKAPIVEDVRNLAEIVRVVGNRKVDIVFASFPCVGFSACGQAGGLANEASGLFFDTVKVIRALRPTMVMYENVAAITGTRHVANFRTILAAMLKSGYNVRWTTCTAASVGAPHIRKRWFCLCVLKDACPPPLVPPKTAFVARVKWSTASMPRLMANKVPDYRHRYSMLGNGIVPSAARLAFFRLYTEFGISTHDDLVARTGTRIAYVPGTSSGMRHAMPHSSPHGSTETRRAMFSYVIPDENAKDWRIVLDPKHYKAAARTTGRDTRMDHRSPLVTRPVKRKQWATVRTSIGTGHILTERMTGDVQTMARFASSVDGIKQTRTDPTTYMSIRFLEWMMGLPRDHTSLK
jgi:DNA (cytosine-5)-methyltransferase 1